MKLVKEYLNEKFTEDSDPIHDMEIGLIKIVKKWLEEHNIRNYTINKDLSIDVKGVVKLKHQLNGNFPDYIKFNKIMAGFFSVDGCNMTSLRGCPESISGKGSAYHGDFNCSENNLESLEGAPKIVTGSFNCGNNGRRFLIKEIEDRCKVMGLINN